MYVLVKISMRYQSLKTFLHPCINAILNETNTNLAFKLLMDNYKSTFNYCFPFIKQNIENKNKQP